MTTNFDSVITTCKNAHGAGSRKVIKQQLQSADELACSLIWYALNPYITFGVQKYTMPKASKSNADYSLFTEVLDDLSSRKLTGNKAVAELENVLSHYTQSTQECLAMVVEKRFRSGFSPKSFNECTQFPKWKVPIFSVMLAQKCSDKDDFEKNVTFPTMADAKLDGNRTIAIVTKNDVVYYNRSGQIENTVNGLFDLELHKIWDIRKEDFVVDGERMASNFTETMNAKKASNTEARDNMRYHVFFIMPLSDWKNQSTSITMEHNHNYINKILKTINSTKLVSVECTMVNSYDEMINVCNKMIDDNGYEGLVLKDPNATYIWDRDFAWTKVKRFYDIDCKVVGMYSGRANSKLENTLGGLIIEGVSERGEKVSCNVGSGFVDKERDEIWNNQNKYLEKTVVVKYQEITSNASFPDVFSLRFPVFVRFRDDK